MTNLQTFILMLLLSVALFSSMSQCGFVDLLSTVSCFKSYRHIFKNPDGDFYLETDEILQKYGYPTENIEVTTADGYILTVFRIPYSQDSPLSSGVIKPPVLITHALMTNSKIFTSFYRKDQNLAMLLADNGFDVFLYNARGTKYSRGHTIFSPTSNEYWDFSFHELGIYDAPAVIDMILNKTGSPKTHYIGYSMGGTQFYVAGSEMPEFINSKLLSAHLLSPAGHVGHTTNPLRLLAPISSKTAYAEHPTLFKTVRLIRNNQPVTHYCTISAINCGICNLIVFAGFGFDQTQVNYTRLPVQLSGIDDTSMKVFAHFAQSINSNKFRKFDYVTAEKNQIHYGLNAPPEYDLSKITVPTVVYHGESDNLVVPKDLLYTVSKLTSTPVKTHIIPYKPFQHLSYMYANNAANLVFKPIIQNLLTGTYD